MQKTRSLTRVASELTKLIESTSTPDSPFHISHPSSFTDATVYPTPSSTAYDEPEAKKRKRNGDGNTAAGGNDIQQARYPNLVLGNKHISKAHQQVKKECEQLAELCVRSTSYICRMEIYHDTTGQGEAMGKSDNAKVS